MPYAKPTDSKKKKRSVMKNRMEAFEQGQMHSGSENGPVVKNRKQAIAISLNMAGLSRPKKKRSKRSKIMRAARKKKIAYE